MIRGRKKGFHHSPETIEKMKKKHKKKEVVDESKAIVVPSV